MDNPVIDQHGTKTWYQHGKVHRDNGPAIERSNGDKSWYQHGKIHRAAGPAYKTASGTKIWYKHSLVHRADGPAIEYANGDKSWHLNDQRLTFDQWLNEAKKFIEDNFKGMF